MSNGFLAVVLGVCAAAFAAACSDESPGGSTGTVGGGPTGTAGGTSSGGSNGVSTGAVADAGLWSPDHDLSLPSAYGFGVTAHAARGSIVTSAGTADPTGKVLRSVIPTTADEGYRGHTKLSSIAPSHFPRPSVAMEYEFRLSTIGGMQFVPAKVGYGLAGAPENADLWNGISYGGTKLSTSWSARLTALPADYLKWRPEYSAGHPWALCAYLYADYAGGRARGDYGIEHLLRDGDGNYFTPVEGQRYTVRVEITTNTPGVRDGRYRVTINGTEYMDLTDVQWNPSGVDQGVSHFLTQTFCNSAISSSATLDQGNLRLLSL